MSFNIEEVREMELRDQVMAIDNRIEEVKFEIRNLNEQMNILMELKYSAKLQIRMKEVSEMMDVIRNER